MTVVVTQVLGSDYAMKVCFEKFLDKINCFVSTAKIKKRAVEKLVMENKRDKVEEEEKE